MCTNNLLQILNALPEAILLVNGGGKIVAANNNASKYLKFSTQALTGCSLNEIADFSGDELENSLRIWRRSRTPVPAPVKWKKFSKADALQIQCKASLLQPASNDENVLIIIYCVVGKSIVHQFTELNSKIDQQQLLLRKLQASREALEAAYEKAVVTLHSIGDAVITTDASGNVEYLNPIAETLTGWQTQEAEGLAIDDIFKIINEVTRVPVVNPVLRVFEEKRVVGLGNHTALISREGVEYVIEDSAAPICDRHGKILGVVLVFRDVTGDRLAQRQLEYLAQHDALTNLKNRYFFHQQLERQVQIAARGNHVSALLYIDLDQFKVINDSAGHAAGDEVLVEMARRFQRRLRQGDILARLGGDEFGVILDDIDPSLIKGIADSYIDAMDDYRFQWEGKFYAVTSSVGAFVIDKNIKTPAEALRCADIACYVAKKSGRNRSHVYNSEDEKIIFMLGEMSVVQEIHAALEQDGFVLFFQPIKTIHDNKTVMYEVLLRLKHADDTLLNPGNFIPVAERNGLMVRIDEWVITHAVQQLKQIHEQDKTCQFAVNLSGASIGDDKILNLLKEFALEVPEVAQSLIIEVTETSAVTHVDKAGLFIDELYALGIRFALDDFGTGFSSFSYLKHLSVEYIKIDGAFVRDIATDPVDQAMVRSINHIAHSLGKLTIAEFVENKETITLLEEIGVDLMQGYYVGRPAPETR